MSTSPSPHQPQRRSISLSRLATIFAVTFAIAFGLCAVSAMAVVGDHQNRCGVDMDLCHHRSHLPRGPSSDRNHCYRPIQPR